MVICDCLLVGWVVNWDEMEIEIKIVLVGVIAMGNHASGRLGFHYLPSLLSFGSDSKEGEISVWEQTGW